MFRKKNTNDLYKKNDIFQKVGKCPLNIDSMLNILHQINIRFRQKIKKTYLHLKLKNQIDF